jgi:ABC-type glycerol-3-phosphate transport system permease component
MIGKSPTETLISPLSVCVLTAIVVGPMAWALVTSLKTEANIAAFPPTFLPSPATVSSYADVFKQKNFAIELFNSVFYAGASIALTLAVSVPAGYAASRLQFPGKRAVMLVVLVTSMIPAVALLIPTYFLLDSLGLLNNPLAIIVLQAARLVPQTIWFMENFVNAVPRELDEATEVDGATRWQTFTRVILPLIKPGIAAAAVLGVITTWNDYITVAAFAPDIGRRTLQVALVNQVFDTIGITWSYVMAFAIISSIPIVLLFIAAQRWFIAGLTAGAVKG